MNQWAFAAFPMRGALEIAGAALLTTFACLVLRWLPLFSAKVIRRFNTSVNRATPYIITAMVVPVALRLALLPLLPVPEPHLHDEFSHLLVAETLATGRLANPPHPLWRHLETIYVLQQPTYSSIYPIGQGIVLAVGKVLMGSPWAGVLLSIALMCGAISWMLYGCLPPQWAAVGSLLSALHYGLADYWVNSYLGGAFCAFGGALLFGAMCRLRSSPSPTMGLLAGLGWSIVWLTRPFESLLPLMIFWGLITWLMIRDRQRWRRWVGPIALFLSIQICAGCATALHNRAVTGSLTTIPYRLGQQEYGVPQSFLRQKAIEEPQVRFAELNDMYWWQRARKEYTEAHSFHYLGGNLRKAWNFFVGPWYSLPILLLFFLFKDWQVIASGGILTGALAASVLYPFFFPHYIAAYSCIIAFLIIRSMMMLYAWTLGGRRVGSLLVLFLMSGGLMTGMRIVPFKEILGIAHPTRPESLREQISDRLMRVGGRHVVFVRYGANHNFHEEWVYNAADVDASPIVWCRAINPTEDAEVSQYYKDRHLWVADVNADAVRMSRYQPEPSEPDLSGASQDAGREAQEWALEIRSPRER